MTQTRREFLTGLGAMFAVSGLEAACATLETVVKSTEPSTPSPTQPSVRSPQAQQSIQSSTLAPTQQSIQPQERKYAVLLIDASDYGLHNPERWINLEHELDCMGKVLQEANSQGIPVFEITFADCIVYGKWKVTCHKSETDSDLAQYKSSNWIRIKKNDIDAFKETSLQQELSQRGITDLIVMGYNQVVCVEATAKTANKLGYRVHTSFDLIQDMASDKCELFINGVAQSINRSNCQIEPNPELGVDVKRTEYFIESTRRFYKENTHLVGDYSQLPIFRR